MSTLQRLLAARSSNNWTAYEDARWIKVSEEFWSSLSDYHDASKVDLEAFSELLKDDALFLTARLVIPELRQSMALQLDSSAKQYILDSTQSSRKLLGDTFDTQIEHFQTRFDKQESSIYHDSMVHRARLLLHDTGPFGSLDQRLVQDWLAACPKATTPVNITMIGHSKPVVVADL